MKLSCLLKHNWKYNTEAHKDKRKCLKCNKEQVYTIVNKDYYTWTTLPTPIRKTMKYLHVSNTIK